MVGDGDRLMPPADRALHKRFCGRHAVHLRHVGVQMQLHALFGGVVLFFDFFGRAHGTRVDDVIALKGIEFHVAVQQDMYAVFELFQQRIALLDLHDHGNRKRIAAVGQKEIDDLVLALFAGAFLKAEHAPPDRHGDLVLLGLGQLDVGDADGLAADDIAENGADAFKIIGYALFHDMLARGFVFRCLFGLLHLGAPAVFLLVRRRGTRGAVACVNTCLRGLQGLCDVHLRFFETDRRLCAEAFRNDPAQRFGKTAVFQDRLAAVVQCYANGVGRNIPFGVVKKAVCNGDVFFEVCG